MLMWKMCRDEIEKASEKAKQQMKDTFDEFMRIALKHRRCKCRRAIMWDIIENVEIGAVKGNA